MQVQLIVANGQVIPVNVPSFMIGRAEGCNLRSRSPQVSRFHCTITVNNSTVMVQDLGGENGTFVNGNRVSSVQTLNDGDKLVVGTHSFVVSIKAGAGKAVPGESLSEKDNSFELASSAASQPLSEQSDTTRPVSPNKTAALKQEAAKPSQEPEIMFEIRLDGQRVSVTKSRLFDLARRGSVLPDDLVTVAGTKVFADSIQGIVFGDKSSAPPPSPPSQVISSTGSSASTTHATTRAMAAPAAAEADPFAFPDLGGADGEAHPFADIASEPYVRVARKESAFSAVWGALDISFSRVYTMEGNNLVIHSLKALYYVIVGVCLLGVFWQSFFFVKDWYESGELLTMLSKHAVGLSVTTFGCVTIIVIVRVLLEMLLLAWIESAKAEQDRNDEDKKG